MDNSARDVTRSISEDDNLEDLAFELEQLRDDNRGYLGRIRELEKVVFAHSSKYNELVQKEHLAQLHLQQFKIKADTIPELNEKYEALKKDCDSAQDRARDAENEVLRLKEEMATKEELHAQIIRKITNDDTILQNNLKKKLAEDRAAHKKEVDRLNTQLAEDLAAHLKEVDRLSEQLAAAELERDSLKSTLEELILKETTLNKDYPVSLRLTPDGWHGILRVICTEECGSAATEYLPTSTTIIPWSVRLATAAREVHVTYNGILDRVVRAVSVFRDAETTPLSSYIINSPMGVMGTLEIPDAWPSTLDPQPGCKGGGSITVVVHIALVG